MEKASRNLLEPLTHSMSISPAATPVGAQRIAVRTDAAPSGGQSCIGRELTITGTIAGTPDLESLYIEGRVEGAIELPASRVTVGANGRVMAGIMACDIVVLGEVLGDLTAAHRIDIRAKATVTGNVCAPRVSMEDGADIHGKLTAGVAGDEPEEASAEKTLPARARVAALLQEPSHALCAPVESRKLRTQSALQPA